MLLKWNHWKVIITFLFFIILPFVSLYPNKLAKSGLLDLRDYDFSNIVNLNGEWEFFPDKFILPEEDLSLLEHTFLNVPGQWNQYYKTYSTSGFGYGSYRLNILLPINSIYFSLKIPDINTAYMLYANGKLIAQSGKISSIESEHIPRYLPLISEKFNASNKVELIFHVSNFNHKKGGLIESIEFGNYDLIKSERDFNYISELFCAATVFILGLYHLLVYILGRKDISTLYFGLTCFVVSLRTISTGEQSIFYFFPNLNWTLYTKMDRLSIIGATSLFSLFLHYIYPKEFSKKILSKILVISLILFSILVLSNIYIVTQLFLILEVYVIAICLFITKTLLQALRNKKEGSILFITGFIVLFACIINDVLYYHFHNTIKPITSYGFIVFILTQSLVISLRFSNAFTRIEKLSEDMEGLNTQLEKTNEVYSKFVPKQFLNILGKENITQIKLGDQSKTEMTILFSDIRGFTKLSEQLTPQQNFEFINHYLKTMTPLIAKKSGFVDKYIGDGIMALYPNSPDDALRSAIDMQKELYSFNDWLTENNISPIMVGIGIHTGLLMLGVIGSEDRMESTVISDAVNLASRIENLTKVYGTSILISIETLFALEDPNEYLFRILDKVKVKGKTQAIPVVEILDGHPPEILDLFISSKMFFEKALGHYVVNEFILAKELFLKVVEINPHDEAAKLYLKRIEYFLNNNITSLEEIEKIKLNILI